MHTHSHAPFSTLRNHLRVSVAAGRRPLDPRAPLPPLAPRPLFLGACSLSTSPSDLLSGRQVTRLPPRQAAARCPLPEHPSTPSPTPLLHTRDLPPALRGRCPVAERPCLGLQFHPSTRAGRGKVPAGRQMQLSGGTCPNPHTPVCVLTNTGHQQQAKDAAGGRTEASSVP